MPFFRVGMGVKKYTNLFSFVLLIILALCPVPLRRYLA